eukprot:gene13599-biopygen1347
MSRSALQYLKTLLSMLTAEEPLHATVLRSLRRLSAAEPIRQAAGISPADMMRLINIAPTWQDQIVFRLAWMTASRWSEIYALTTDCFLARVCWLGNPYWLQQHADFGLGNDPQNIKRQAVPGVPVRPILRAPSGDAAAITSRSRPRVSVDDHHGLPTATVDDSIGKAGGSSRGVCAITRHTA